MADLGRQLSCNGRGQRSIGRYWSILSAAAERSVCCWRVTEPRVLQIAGLSRHWHAADSSWLGSGSLNTINPVILHLHRIQCNSLHFNFAISFQNEIYF